MLSDSLHSFGLTSKEIIIYLTVLRLGSATASNIAKIAQTNRPYCYEVLESLKAHGLVTHITKNNIKQYQAVDPKYIEQLMKEKEEHVLKALPELSALFRSIEHLPQAEIYEGIEGIKNILDDIVKTGSPVSIYSSVEKQTAFLDHHFPRYIKQRTEKDIPARVISERSLAAKKIQSKDKEEFRELRFFPRSFNQATATHIYADKIAIFSLEGTYFGIIIKNEAIAKTQQYIFDMMWDIAEKN